MRSNALTTLLIKILIICEMLIIVLRPFRLDTVVSILFAATFFIVAALWAVTVYQKRDVTDYVAIAAAVIAVINVTVNALLTDTTLSFGYMKKCIMFCFSLMWFTTASKLIIDKKTGKFISNLVAAATVILALLYVVGGEQMYVINGVVSRYLTFRFSNPNMTGIILVCMTVFMIVFASWSKNKANRITYVVMYACLIYFIYKTESRNCFIALAAFFGLTLYSYFKKNRNRNLNKRMCGFIAAWPMVFAGVYFFVLNSKLITRMLSFLVSEGKKLDSRVSMWTHAFGCYSESPFIGAYSQISNATGTGQMHNTHVDILASYGPIVLLLVCWLLYRYMCNQDKRTLNYPEYMNGFICTIMIGMGEAAFFSGGLGIYIFAGIFLLMANMESGKPVQGKPASKYYEDDPEKSIYDNLKDLFKLPRGKKTKQRKRSTKGRRAYRRA